MKTKIKSKVIAIVTILSATLFLATSAKAQISNPYPVKNNLHCSIEISYTIQDAGCHPCLGGTGTSPIAPGTIFSLPLPGTCVPTCNIFICVIKVDGVSVSSTCADNAGPSNSGTGAGSCPGTFNINWSAAGTIIN